MKFPFKFLLNDGSSVILTFTASEFSFAHRAAAAYSSTAFRAGEVYDFFYLP